MIEFEDVRIAYKDKPVLDGVSLTIHDREFFVLIGSSGCGKTTLLKSINKLLPLRGGSLSIDGIPVEQIKVQDLPKKVGYVVQSGGLFPHLTVEENIALTMQIARFSKEAIRDRVDKMLKMVNLDPEIYRGQYPSQLSGGQQQRVALARMMIGEPEAILLDEPFSALDGYLKDALQKDMEDFLKQYQGDMIMVTHSRDEAFRFCKELMLLKDGRTLTFGDTRHLFEQPGLLEVARLTGCKNNSRARKLGAYEIEALDWGLKLHTTQEVPDDITHVAIRGHWMQPADTPGQNTVPFEVQDYIETTFEHQYLVKCPNADTDAVLWWMRPKPNFQLDPRANLPKYLYLPPEHLMLLKP